MNSRVSRTPRLIAAALAVTLTVSTLAACSVSGQTVESSSTTEASTSSEVVATASSLWDTTVVHEISVTVDDVAAYDELIQTYLDSGEKIWISATVTIDGTTFTNVGIKLKGNSSLRGLSSDEAQSPQDLPWIIRLDKFVDDQNYDGDTELVVRGNSTETALNEAVALALLGETGLATELAAETRFSMNGSAAALRLVIQNPGESWDAANFASDGLLYKAEAEGDYSYRGDDPEAYAEAFDQEAGDDDLTPLIAFLKFINEADDATFAAELSQYLDVESFATYLAFQDLIDNFDDISGPGNNSYLRYDESTGLMTVVSWDLNLAFGQSPGGGGGDGGGGGGQRPGGGGQAPGDDGAVGGGSQSNVLADRFLADPDFAALYDAAAVELSETLYASGLAQNILDAWVELLKAQAADLVPAATVDAEASVISSYLDR